MTINSHKLSDRATIILLCAALIALGFTLYATRLHREISVQEPSGEPDVVVDLPVKGQEAASPLIVSGKARGFWFFEGVFPARIEDSNGNIIAQSTARAAGDWMTNDFVMFDAVIDYKAAEKMNAFLVLEKDNPSGLPENSKKYSVPIVLLPSSNDDFFRTGNLIQPQEGEAFWYLSYEEPGNPGLKVSLIVGDESRCVNQTAEDICDTAKFEPGQRVEVAGKKIADSVIVSAMTVIPQKASGGKTVKLYYYDAELDKDASGNVLCSRQGLVFVEREIPATITPIQDAIKLLIKGGLTQEERQRGITTEYPLPGFDLKGAALKNGVLTLDFLDPENRTSGGACRVGVLWFQIEATAKQFEGVKIVKPKSETIFQP